MAQCCPPGRGCNSPKGDETCALALCDIARHEPEAALALARWEELQHLAPEKCAQQRFARRAYERARDRALRALAMRVKPWMLTRPRRRADTGQIRRAGRRRGRPRRGATPVA